MEINQITFEMIKKFGEGSEPNDSILIVILRQDANNPDHTSSQVVTKLTCGAHVAGAIINTLQALKRISTEAGDEAVSTDVGKVLDFVMREVFQEIETQTERRKKFALGEDGERVELVSDKSKLN